MADSIAEHQHDAVEYLTLAGDDGQQYDHYRRGTGRGYKAKEQAKHERANDAPLLRFEVALYRQAQVIQPHQLTTHYQSHSAGGGIPPSIDHPENRAQQS